MRRKFFFARFVYGFVMVVFSFGAVVSVIMAFAPKSHSNELGERLITALIFAAIAVVAGNRWLHWHRLANQKIN